MSRRLPLHWGLRGPSRTNRVGILRWRNVYGGHVAGLWRVLRLGPWQVLLLRYRPGEVDEP